jgi:DNA polymerase III delta subunit
LEIIKDDVFRKQLKKGISGAYMFFGDEDYMKLHTLNAVRESICPDPSFAMFNEFKIDVMDYSPAALLDALMPLPMMSEKKLVTVNGLNIDGLRAKEIDELCDVLSALDEYDYNIVIISVPAGQFDPGTNPKKPSTTCKKLSEYLTPVRFDPVMGAKLVTWVEKHFNACGVKASPDVCAFLIEYSGRSMYTLSNETEKLSYYVLANGRDTVTKEDVQRVSVAELSTDVFALANAILDGRSEYAMKALEVMRFRRVDPLILNGQISQTVCDIISIKALLDEGMSVMEISSALKMNDYRTKLYAQSAAKKSMQRLKAMIDLCAEVDSILKFSQQGYSALERLVCGL